MKMPVNMQKFSVSILLVLSLLISTSTSVFATSPENGDSDISNETAMIFDNEIQTLFNKRAELISDKTQFQSNSNLLLQSEADLQEIDEQLSALGVVKLSDGYADSASLYTIGKPDSNINDWYLYTNDNIQHNGKRYVVQTLVVQPKSNSTSSQLLGSGTKIIQVAPGLAAGTINLFKSVTTSALGALIPEASVALSVYDAANSFLSGFQTTTIVNNIKAVYLWNSATTATFRYENEYGKELYQQLAYSYTRCSTTCAWNLPVFNYQNNLSTNIIQGKKQFVSAIEGSDNIMNAVYAFNDTYKPSTAFISVIEMRGPSNELIGYVSPLTPIGPGIIS